MSDIITTPPQQSTPDWLQRPLLAALTVDWEKVIYASFIVVAIITRFWGLGSRVMSHDESLHTQFSYQYYNGDGYSHTPLMHGPFLFHLTAAFYWLFGPGDFSARAPVAIFGVILVIMPYFLRPWIGRIGAIFASFLLLISPYITYYSRYIRHDIYVIVWALIVFLAIWWYLHYREEKHLWWFAAGMALMFATKEVSYIYVAIFGSLLLWRIGLKIWKSDWFWPQLPRLRNAIIVLLAGLILIGAGGVVLTSGESETEPATVTPTDEGFAADPTADTAAGDGALDGNNMWARWLVIAGIAVFSAALVMAVQQLRPYLEKLAEFDLIMLFVSLVLPLASPLLPIILGWNPLDYTISTCTVDSQQALSAFQVFWVNVTDPVCWNAFFESGLLRTGFFLVITLIIGTLLGLWWNSRRWLVIAAIFHSIFLVLYTSVFTNPGGWTSGMVGSLGYWWEQHDVQRGNQPWFYYGFVTTFYEFLPIIFSTLAVRLWMKRKQINRLVGYWLTVVLVALLTSSFVTWIYGRSFTIANQEIPELGGFLGSLGLNTADLVGYVIGLLFFGLSILFWFLVQRRRLLAAYGLEDRSFRDVMRWQSWLDFVPAITWWLILTWLAYSVAGEKMPWLSTHFVIPMVFLAGWYFREILKGQTLRTLLARPSLVLWGLTVLLITMTMLALGPLLLGHIDWGNQTQANLSGIGRFLGGLVTAVIVGYFWWQSYQRSESATRRPIITLGVFALLSLLTVRFTYMANWPNADYTTEYLVYAHGAPATKEIVLDQVEELSMRMYGDKSIRVAFDNDVSWPYTWYLRDYPNRYYFGETPNQSLNDSPIILVGNRNWNAVEPYLGNNYDVRTYTFLWWPMEEYRKFGWEALFGSPLQEERRGLGNANVRQALWDIFFYRDYERYGEVFGGEYTAASWPLRHELRVYIRKDALVNLWDYGIGAVNATGLIDPYAEGEILAEPALVLNEIGLPGAETGQFNAPRNAAIGPNGLLYVTDAGNHRIQVFDAESGEFVRAWGQPGTEPGQFNEPWGLAVTENAVYVADTWNHRIQKFTLDGELIGAYGQSGGPNDTPDTGGLGLFFGPRDIAALPDGRFLITDTGNHRFQIMDADGNFVAQQGGFGNLPGQMNEPVGLAVDPDGTIYLADTWNGRVQQFSPDLAPLSQWPIEAWFSQSINNKPYLAVDDAGRIYLTDPEGYRLLVFDQTGSYLGRLGQFGTELTSFGLPNGIALDADNNVYVVDSGNNRVLKYPAFFPPAAAAESP